MTEPYTDDAPVDEAVAYDETPDESRAHGDKTVAELRAEAGSRGLSTTGTKPELVERLTAADEGREPVSTAKASGPLVGAGESGDPEVHKLLAEREIHRSNLEPDDPGLKDRRKAVQAEIDKIDDRLAELGYTAK